MTTTIYVITVMFLLSLVGAFVLFKWLDSTALIKKASWQAGGSLAGFVLIFCLLFRAYLWIESEDQDVWRIVGHVERANGSDHSLIEISVEPPPKDVSSVSGRVELVNVPIHPNGQSLRLFAEGYYDKVFEIYVNDLKKSTGVAEIDPETRTIKLEDTTLYKLGMD